MPRALTVFLLALVGSVSASLASAATCPERVAGAAGVPIVVAPEVEEEVCLALLSAVRLLPVPHRAQLEALTVGRERDLGVPRDAPLIDRLFGAGAIAYYQVSRHRLVITDAGATGRPRWTGERVLDTWGALLFDAVVRFAVVRNLGEQLPLEELLVHELGHVLLLGPNGGGHDVEAWGMLSAWRERERDEPADGYVSGFFQSEQPAVALRLALGLGRGPDAHYEPRAGGFATLYARFDPMEDFAEAYRLALTRPDALAAVAPEKLVAVTGRGMRDQPAARLDRDALEAGARRLLGHAPGPASDLGFAVRVLRPHAARLLPLARRLGARGPHPVPEDLPADAREHLSRLFVSVGDREILIPSRASFLAYAEGVADEVEELREFERALPKLGVGKPVAPPDMNDPYDQVSGLAARARALLGAGDLAGARRVALEIRGDTVGARVRAELLVEICRARPSAAADREARAAARRILFPGWRASVEPCIP